ncbi:hypothetical protein IWQ57_000067 [Coemansia nantahalensis]|uniref:Uncharacterized protein n=1 Tax=Coemansia nantahalensis TaxID=2789366 RepID=A0ACC1K9M8_9FUNG|nr:hypothetical protein IWQ57_000067 [Coemansia nantahalensis]
MADPPAQQRDAGDGTDRDGLPERAPRQQQSPPPQSPPGSPSRPRASAFLTGSSQLPARTSAGRPRLIAARATPYTLASPRSARYLSTGDITNIPRAAQFHAVGMPARHPLGVQTKPAHSDTSTESADSAPGRGSPPADVVSAAASGGDSTPATPPSSGQDGLALASEEDEPAGASLRLTASPEPRSASGGAGLGVAPAEAGAGIVDSRSGPRQHQRAPSPPAIAGGSGGGLLVIDCPICLEPMREAFMTVCGHSFCYQCISRHLTERHSCPTCARALEGDQVYPNFALNKLLTQMDAAALRPSSIVEQIRSTVEGDEALDPQDIDALLLVLQQKKRALRNSVRQFEMTTLRQFLLTARARKAAAIDALRKELLCVEEDLDFVADQLEQSAPSDDGFAESRYLAKVRMLPPGRMGDAVGAQVPNSMAVDDGVGALADCVSSSSLAGGSLETAAATAADSAAAAAADMVTVASPVAAERAQYCRRVSEHYNDLEAYYFDMRMRGVGEEGLGEFMETLTTVSRYERFRQVATLRYGDSTASTAIVASIEFDRDEEIFAVAGVARKIKIYDYTNVMQQAEAWGDYSSGKAHLRRPGQAGGRQEWWSREGDGAEDEPAAAMSTMMQYPAAEYTNRSKISCLSFNPYIKAQLACSDYDGTVSLWDVGAGTPTMSLGEHEKRAWSLDFSHADPTRLCSGSDDGKVKIWTTNRRSSVLTIEGKANVCCVRFNPLHGNILSFGSADHNVHCFDLRAPKQPLCVLRGHRKAVSYTRFLTPDEIISASTDSSLKLWNMRTQECIRTYTGHANEKNFVGLTISNGEWIACGSENNTMYAYHRNLSHPAVTHRFGNCNPVTGVEQVEDDPSLFVSAVCWKNRTNTILSANSQGIIKILDMA